MSTEIQSFATRGALAAAPTSLAVAYLEERGREGMFRWTPGDRHGFVEIDPQQGIHVAPSNDISGHSGAWTRVYSGPIDIRWFGAVLDDALFQDTAFTAWMSYLIKLNLIFPAHGTITGGKPRGYIPHGRIKLQQGFTLEGNNAYGLTIEGDGPGSTSIELHNDSATLFDFFQYSDFELSRISLRHVPQSANPANWTCKVFSTRGEGSGKKFRMSFVEVLNFAYGFHIYDTYDPADEKFKDTNCDTTLWEHTTFTNTRTVVWARSGNAVINKFLSCTFGGSTESIFDIVNFGWTCVDTCNIVMDGTWFRLNGHPTRWGPGAQYLIINTKGEPSATAPMARTKLIELVGNNPELIECSFKFINSGVSSANVVLDSAVKQIQITPRIRFEWDGGELEPAFKIETLAQLGTFPSYRPLAIFKNMARCPGPANVVRTNHADDLATHVPIVWENCVGLPNLCSAGQLYVDQFTALPPNARQRNVVTQTAWTRPQLSHDGTNNHYALPFYGKWQRIESVTVDPILKGGGNLSIAIFEDAARTLPVDTITFTSADNGPYGPPKHSANAAGLKTKEGLYFSISADTINFGSITVVHRAI